MKAIIVDDEKLARQYVANLLAKYFTDFQVMDECNNGSDAIKSIIEKTPDLVFLDVQMPGMSGFQMLDTIPRPYLNFQVIFVTSHEHYAIRAIKYAAFDYLLKPVIENEFVECIQRLRQSSVNHQQLDLLKSNLATTQKPSRIAIHHQNGLSLLSVGHIIMMKSYKNYTEIFMKDGQSTIASKTLAHFTKLLEDHPQPYFFDATSNIVSIWIICANIKVEMKI